ncbi:hypothetical protein DOM22_12485 [Bdellovibrio sp. ZAP7]|uniref:hypothetical protein n=1 Tax=Bdellovibrio sp. ZAP7 TaxID=2231053 RepID=UPI00115B82A4|nr:hypothetical protein [Bdellovibrio sp. ZAP7]QDK45908.1 hypothetical protein DOM22_12485 [Bdellovibrio sp. ZAP7]
MKVQTIGRILGLLLSLNALPANAEVIRGTESGGGGHVLACYTDNTHKTLESVVLYDLWEQAQLSDMVYLQFKDFAAAYSFIDKQLAKIDDSSFANSWYSRHLESDSNTLYQEVVNGQNGDSSKNTIIRFIGDSSNLKVIPDLGSFIEPNDDRCIIQAMGNYRSNGILYISKPLFEKLSPTSQAAFILHETIYRYRRNFGETNSVYTRRLTAQTMAGTELINADGGLSEYIVNKKAIKCSSTDNSYVFYAFKPAVDSSGIQLQFERIQGFDVLNKTTAARNSTSYFYKDFFGEPHQCAGECTHPEGFVVTNSWTPVDKLPESIMFQRTVSSEGKTIWEIYSSISGASKRIPFSCQTL